MRLKISLAFLSMAEKVLNILLMKASASSLIEDAFSSLKAALQEKFGPTPTPVILLSYTATEEPYLSPSIEFVSPTYKMLREMFLSCQMPWDDLSVRLDEDEVFRRWWDKQNALDYPQRGFKA